MKLYQMTLRWLYEETQKGFPDWERIDKVHMMLPKLWKRRMRMEGYI